MTRGLMLAFVAVFAAAKGTGMKIDNPSDYRGLENVLEVSPRLISGGEPHGVEGFESLKELGVRTIVSVDGATPAIDAARAAGMRYVHIPIGYDGIEPQSAAAMARVLRECESPIYIHCHHGQHRGPAMAAVALRLETSCPAAEALDVLRRAGTGSEYEGLWHDVEVFDCVSLEGIEAPLYEKAPRGDMQVEMAAIDRIWDRLTLCKEAEWTTPKDHPDVSPQHEALLMEEHLRELLRAPSTPRKMVGDLEHARAIATALHQGLMENRANLDDHFAALHESCKTCHAKFRN